MTFLGRRDDGQFDEGATSNQNLSAKRIGLGQQTLSIADQLDLARGSQISNPGLAVVWVWRQQAVRQHPASHVACLKAFLPGLHCNGWVGRRTPCQGQRHQYGPASYQANESPTLGFKLIEREMVHADLFG
jgi:hypothetical protein